MLYLEAIGPEAGQVASWRMPEDRAAILGRSKDSDCPLPWDPLVSRRHAELIVCDETLVIRCFENARNQIFRGGEVHSEVRLAAGNECRIGNTRLRVRAGVLDGLGILGDNVAGDAPTTDLLIQSSDYRVAVVSRHTPALWMSRTEEELGERTVEILRRVMPHADLFAVLECDNIESASRPHVVYWHKPASRGTRTYVSRRLIGIAIEGTETAIQVETDDHGEPVEQGRWAFCIPVRSEAARLWCIYVGGAFGEGEGLRPRLRASDLVGDASLTELVGQLVGAIRHVRSLEDRFAGVRQFFSPSVLSAVATRSLMPRETDVVVLYCDLRGFSRMMEQSDADLHGLLHRISSALGVMTQSIIDLDGVIADFQGDSALGFWGWPVSLEHGPLPACRAALRIRRLFEEAAADADHHLTGFQAGIGVASGRAIAGRIGTREQAKIGVFGPVVNVAARLEGLTKAVGVPILLDNATAEEVRRRLPPSEGRCRHIGRLQPVGFETPVEVSELLPPEFSSDISDRDVAHFDGAVEAFEDGDWERARDLLGTLPAHDRARDFLLVQIATNNYQPPPGWNGVIQAQSK